MNTNKSIQAYPNPFNSKSGITFKSNNEIRELHVLDINGKNVYSAYELNRNCILWNGKTNDGKDLPSGLYFLRSYDKTNNNNLILLKSE